MKNKNDATDVALSIRTSDEEISNWDRNRIIEALKRETNVDEKLANKISLEVEKQIKTTQIKTLTTALVRELVNAKLIEYGLEKERLKHDRLGVPFYDVEALMVQPNKENANVPHGPEATNLTLAEEIKKDFAFREVFSKEVGMAHLRGDLHLHDLGFVDRPYSFLADECILVKNKYGIIGCTTFRQLWETGSFIYEENGFEISPLRDYFVYDKEGWVPLQRIVRHKREDKNLLWIKTQDSKSLILTEDHPMISEDREFPAKDLKITDQLNVCKNFPEIQKFSLLNLLNCDLGKERIYYADNVLINGHRVSGISQQSLKEIKDEDFLVQTDENSLIYAKDRLGKLNPKTDKYHTSFILTPEFCYIIGMFIAKGYYDKRTLSFTGADENLIYISELLKSCGFKSSLRDMEDEKHKLCVDNVFLVDLFKYVFQIGVGTRYKSLPPFILMWRPELIFAVISGIIDGDGTVTNTNRTCVSITTASRSLVNQIQQLLFIHNMKSCVNRRHDAGKVRVYQGKKIVQNYEMFYVAFGIPCEKKDSFSMCKKLNCINEAVVAETCNITLPEKIEKFLSEEEYVYDITTDSGTFYCNGILVHNCSGQSLEYVKKFGLNLPNAMAIARPAHRAEVLLAHIVKFAAALQCHFAGAIGWDAINLFFAPYLVGKTQKELHQLAQMLIFEFSQQAVARGGQAIFTDINLYWEIPKHFEDTPAIGPGGEYTGKTYGEYAKESQAFAWALFDVYKEGDGSGRPFMFPKPLLHITEKFFNTPGHKEFLNHVCDVASKMGSPYFVFDRGSTAKISECCRLSFKLEETDLQDAKYPWKMRYCALQNVTLNLPRIGYTCKGDKVFDRITRLFNLVVKAHLQKQRYIKKILGFGCTGPLALLAMDKDGQSYLKLDKVSYLIGMVGLNELVKTQCGQEMHQSEEAFRYGVSIIAHMKLLTDQACKKHNMHFVLEQTPAESLLGSEKIQIVSQNNVEVITIGDFIDKYLNKEGTYEFPTNDDEIIKTFAINSKFKTEILPITRLYKHKRRSKVYRVILESDKEINVTDCHSLYSLEEDGSLVPRSLKEFKKGDWTVLVRNSRSVESQNEYIPNITGLIKKAQQELCVDLIRHIEKDVCKTSRYELTRVVEVLKHIVRVKNITSPSLNLLKQILHSDLIFEQIKSIELINNQPEYVYDIEVANCHNFMNIHGILAHNSTAYRFARLDLKDFSKKAKDIVLGDIDTNSVYYTNSTQFNSEVVIDPITRIQQEGLFHPLIEAGSISHCFLGEHQPSAESLANFVVKVFKNTKNDQIAFSPEFTTCCDCERTSRGLLDQCSYCGSKNVEGITRITGYFSKISGWNKGKIQELRDRVRVQI